MARILVIASFTPSLVKFRGDMMRDWLDRGHEVVCCSPNPDPDTLLQLEDLGVVHRTYRLQRTGMNPLADLATIRDLARLIAEIAPDHVLSYTIKPVIYGSLAAGRRKVPRIAAMITGLGTTFLKTGMRGSMAGALGRFMYHVALKNCGTVFFQNPDDSGTFVNLGLVDPAKVVHINGSGINLERFAPVPVPAPPPVFLLIARLVRDKGIAEFAEAARIVKARHPEALFQVAGFFDDHPRALSPGEMEAWTASGTLEFLGPVNDVRPLLRDCSVYCLPSYREGTPRSVLEAMATGRAIITTDTAGCRETVVHGENGYLVPVADPKSLAAAMELFCEDPHKAVTMGAVSRRLAAEKFDVVRVNADIRSAMGLDQAD